MKTDKKRKTLEDSLHWIDGLIASLNAYPSLEDALLNRAQTEANKFLGQFFPTQLDFGKEILEHLVGTDALIQIMSDFLTLELPKVEISLKGVLLANMHNLGTNCTIDPIIYEKAIKEGIVFDLKQIDLYDKLTISPLDKKIGQYYYFGTEGCESAYDILQSAISPNNQPLNTSKGIKAGTSIFNRAFTDSVGHYFGYRKRDFDCLLWYMKNKAVNREVWGKRTSQSEDIFNGDSNVQGWINKKGSEKTVYYQIKDDKIQYYLKEGSKLKSPTNKRLIPVEGNIEYTYRKGTSFYTYSYSNPSYKKLNRSKWYVNRINENYFKLYYWNETSTSWVDKEIFDTYNYPYMEALPTNIEAGSIVVVDNKVYRINSDPKIKKEAKKDSNGKEITMEYVSNVKSEECVDITNDLSENTAIFVDYGISGTEEKVNKGTATSAIDDTNTGSKTWVSKLNKKAITEGNVEPGNLYYIKKSAGNEFDPNVDVILIPPYFIDDKGKAKYCVNINDKIESKNKYTKDFGVLTLEFSPRTGNVLQSDGKPMQQQTPYDNVLHVFFGNVKELPSTERDKIQEDWKNASNDYKQWAILKNKLERVLTGAYYFWKQAKTKWKNDGTYIGNITKIGNHIYTDDVWYQIVTGGLKTIIYGDNNNLKTTIPPSDVLYKNTSAIMTIFQKINSAYKRTLVSYEMDDYYGYMLEDNSGLFNDYENFKDDIYSTLNGYSLNAYTNHLKQIMDNNENLVYISAKDFQYPEAAKNYYFKKTLFEFNTDYINSLQLFDSKVLAAQIITSLFGGATMSLMIGATASWKTEYIREVVKSMVEKVIAAEDFEVSDCFFTFSNDTYNSMLNAADLRQAGLYSRKGEENGNNTIDPSKLLEGLNGIDDAADQAGQSAIITGAILTAAAEVSKDIYKENSYLSVNSKFGINASFIELLMLNLCTQVVMAILSPKVYLLILINLEMFGMSTNFDIKSFIQCFETLIRSIVKDVVDQFMQYLADNIKKIIGELVEKLKPKLMFEQAEMYARLLKQILMHLRMLSNKGKTYGWTQDMVTSADILSSDSVEPKNEC